MDLVSLSLSRKDATLLPFSLDEEEAHSVGSVVSPTKVVYNGSIVALHSVEWKNRNQTIYMVYYTVDFYSYTISRK